MRYSRKPCLRGSSPLQWYLYETEALSCLNSTRVVHIYPLWPLEIFQLVTFSISDPWIETSNLRDSNLCLFIERKMHPVGRRDKETNVGNIYERYVSPSHCFIPVGWVAMSIENGARKSWRYLNLCLKCRDCRRSTRYFHCRLHCLVQCAVINHPAAEKNPTARGNWFEAQVKTDAGIIGSVYFIHDIIIFFMSVVSIVHTKSDTSAARFAMQTL